MKTALVSMMDDNFLPGFIGFVKSAKKNSPCVFDYPWVFIDVGLSDKVKDQMKDYYSNISFVKPNKKNYECINMNATTEKLRNTYYTFEVFNMTEFDKIVFLDMDILVLGDISMLFELTNPISGAQCYNAARDHLRDDINTGVFVINKPIINESHYLGLISYSQGGLSMPDQKAINRYFLGKINFLPKEYNMEKRTISSKQWDWKKARILHFVSRKPWATDKPAGNEVGFDEMENLWKEYYNG